MGGLRRFASVVGCLAVVGLLLGVAPVGASSDISRSDSPASASTGDASLVDGPGASAVVAAGAGSGLFTGVSPARLLDTRAGRSTVDGVGAGGGAFTGVRSVKVAGRGGVPGSGVGAVVLNVTATGPSAEGYLSVFPAGEARPNTSNVNYVRAGTAATAVIAKLGTDGAVSVFASSRTDVLVDVAGWFVDGDGYTGLSPARLVDSRPGRATVDGVNAGGGAFSGVKPVKVTGRGGVPGSGVGAVVLSVTATGPVGGGYTTVFPAGEARPNASNVNFVKGQTVANLVVAKVGDGGVVNVFNSTAANVLVDVAGWLPADSDYTALSPARLVDTRANGVTAAGGYSRGGAFTGVRSYQVAGRAGVPDDGAGVVVLNVTATGPVGGGYTTVFPADESRPNASNVNFVKGQTVANLVVAKLGADGSVSVFNSAKTDLIIDVLGWMPEPPVEEFKAESISAGFTHTCAVTTTGAAKCWGDNRSGQLGDGTTTNRLTPVTVTGLETGVKSITAGYDHTCALTTADAVRCWGFNGAMQVGDGTTTNRLTPVTVTGLESGVKSISAGSGHTCAVTTTGAAKCWGNNFNGQLGSGTRDIWGSTLVSVTGLATGVQSISGGWYHTCALMTSGSVKCWGNNLGGELGDGTTEDRLTPVVVSVLGSGVASVSAGGSHSCAITTSGAAKCWGDNSSGQLGDDTTTNRLTPVTVTGLETGVESITGGGLTCAVTTAGVAKCWGNNSDGRLGDGTTTDRLTPVTVIGTE